MKKHIATRRVDHMGRLVLPVEARRALGLSLCGSIEIYLDSSEQKIILQKASQNDFPPKTA